MMTRMMRIVMMMIMENLQPQVEKVTNLKVRRMMMTKISQRIMMMEKVERTILKNLIRIRVPRRAVKEMMKIAMMMTINLRVTKMISLRVEMVTSPKMVKMISLKEINQKRMTNVMMMVNQLENPVTSQLVSHLVEENLIRILNQMLTIANATYKIYNAPYQHCHLLCLITATLCLVVPPQQDQLVNQLQPLKSLPLQVL
jgi:hypothetical protein